MKAPFKRGTRLIYVPGNSKCKYLRWWGMQRAPLIVVEFDTGAVQTVHEDDVIIDPGHTVH